MRVSRSCPPRSFSDVKTGDDEEGKRTDGEEDRMMMTMVTDSREELTGLHIHCVSLPSS